MVQKTGASGPGAHSQGQIPRICKQRQFFSDANDNKTKPACMPTLMHLTRNLESLTSANKKEGFEYFYLMPFGGPAAWHVWQILAKILSSSIFIWCLSATRRPGLPSERLQKNSFWTPLYDAFRFRQPGGLAAMVSQNFKTLVKHKINSAAFETRSVLQKKRLRHTGAVRKAGKGFWTLVRISIFLIIYKQCGPIVVSKTAKRATQSEISI